VLYVGDKKRITLGDVETLVLAAKQRSFYELTDAISSRDRGRAWRSRCHPSTGDGDEAAIGHLYMLARTFARCWLSWSASAGLSRLVAGTMAGFSHSAVAAEDIIRQARRYKSRRELTSAIRRVARADLALRSNPPSKRLILEHLVLDLTAEPKLQEAGWCRMSCRCDHGCCGVSPPD